MGTLTKTAFARVTGSIPWGGPVLAALLVLAAPAQLADAVERQTAAGPVLIEAVAEDLDTPWGIAFLPEGGFLVTLRDGELLYFDPAGKRRNVAGVPDVHAEGQGGLLDVAVSRNFSESSEIFLTYARPHDGTRSATALAVARLSTDRTHLEDLRVLFMMTPPASGGRHFGSRVIEAPDGSLFVTLGDRADRERAQDLATHHGKIVRIARDGSVPPDNPFAGDAGVRPETWSLGHRNPQGAALDLDGGLWAVEHGARGGDEINRILPGRNYGWPVISYGTHYSGAKIGEGVAKQGLEQPEFYWDPSIAPSGMMIYSGALWPAWREHFFVGSLKFDYISRLDPSDGLDEVEQLAFPETSRVRDVREAADGSIWFLSEGNDAIYRMIPARRD